jgi:hypothetical protein
MQPTTLEKRDGIDLAELHKSLTLVEANFAPDEAEEILMKLFADKLNFYKIKNWSSRERYAKDDEVAQLRIAALHEEVDKLKAILSEAKNQDKNLVVSAEIKIMLVDRSI